MDRQDADSSRADGYPTASGPVPPTPAGIPGNRGTPGTSATALIAFSFRALHVNNTPRPIAHGDLGDDLQIPDVDERHIVRWTVGGKHHAAVSCCGNAPRPLANFDRSNGGVGRGVDDHD